MNAQSLLQEIQSLYFTDSDQVRKNVDVTIETIIDLRIRLIDVELEEGFNAQTEAIESLVDELEKEFITE